MMEERKYIVTVRRVDSKPEGHCQNEVAKGALGLTLLGALIDGLPYVGWAFLGLSILLSLAGLRKRPRRLAIVALLINAFFLWMKITLYEIDHSTFPN